MVIEVVSLIISVLLAPLNAKKTLLSKFCCFWGGDNTKPTIRLSQALKHS